MFSPSLKGSVSYGEHINVPLVLIHHYIYVYLNRLAVLKLVQIVAVCECVVTSSVSAPTF